MALLSTQTFALKIPDGGGLSRIAISRKGLAPAEIFKNLDRAASDSVCACELFRTCRKRTPWAPSGFGRLMRALAFSQAGGAK
jgi:hypothetical protein